METTTNIDTSATPAKCALLARLHNNHVSRTDDELRAHIAAAIDAARVPYARGNALRLDVACGDDDDDELAEPAPQPALPPSPADGLKTPAQAARRLGISIRTLRDLVSSGELRYVNVGRGKQRERVMFTDNDLSDLIASRTRQKARQCQSTSPRARRSTTSTSSGEVVAFTALRSERNAGKRKP
jgi:excisionase family DNA binding protein